MKIIHIVRRYGPAGGMERYVWETTRELMKFGYRMGKWLRAHLQPGWLIHSHERVRVHHVTIFHATPYEIIYNKANLK